jgi:thioredoxin-related protein/uncharacterized protein YciI
MLKIIFAVLLIPGMLTAQQTSTPPNWDAWNFLMGEWKGEGGGDPGQGTGTFSFTPDLDYTIITRKNHTVYPAAKDRPAFTHDDLMTVYQIGGATKAIYFDNEGHTINYTVEFSNDSNSIIFLSDPTTSTPRFRLTYTKVEVGTVRITFDIAPPGKPEDFSQYLEGIARRTRCVLTDNPEYAAIEIFDPKRDAAKDISDAIVEATKSNRRIILDVGGNWCVWCRRLDSLFKANEDLSQFMNKNYVVVKVNFSKENENEKVLSQYPEIKGYPHLFILDKDGKLIHSLDTGELESGKGHSKEKVFAFLKKWVLSSSSKDEFEMKDGDTTYTMKKYYFCFLKKGPIRDQDSVTVAKLQEEHLAHISKLAKEGKISVVGPYDDDADIRGIMIFNVNSKEEAEKLESEDPAVKAGRLAIEVHPWWGAKGSKLP